jgi:DNA-nicking Smr family endonuclease
MIDKDWENFKKKVVALKKDSRIKIKKKTNEITIKHTSEKDISTLNLDLLDEKSVDSKSLEKNTLRKIKKGKIRIEAQLDLHGNTIDESKIRVVNFILENYKKQKRLVLIITGKGRKTSSKVPWGENLGKLRLTVPQWLNSIELSKYILWFDEANQQNGGSGALMIYLKKLKNEL